MTPGCVSAQLSPLIDGELDASAAARVEQHLTRCAACRGEWSLLIALRGSVRDLPREGVSTRFETAFAVRLDRERSGRASRLKRTRLTRWLALPAAAALLCAGLWYAARPGSPPGASARPEPPWPALAAPPLAADTPGLDCGRDEPASTDEQPCADAASCGRAPSTAPGLLTAPRQRPSCVRAGPRREQQAPPIGGRPVSWSAEG
jgi:hypothetical protein